MVHAKEVLSDHSLANANDLSWYTPFSKAVECLSEEQALWKPDENSHSAAEIVQHLLYWNRTWQVRYQESDFNAVPPLENNNQSFEIPADHTFNYLKDQLLAVLLRRQVILTKEKVESSVARFPVPAEWWALLANATTHNAYLIGPIIYIRKLQGSWKTGK